MFNILVLPTLYNLADE